ncbi:MAG: hypothetical protein H0X66_08900 [Verrucomicrobia bacterium]|nr:hypothetical protein [Verrucomicrobiota bacterium]
MYPPERAVREIAFFRPLDFTGLRPTGDRFLSPSHRPVADFQPLVCEGKTINFAVPTGGAHGVTRPTSDPPESVGLNFPLVQPKALK